ncbi:DUF927 domain-containing protein [Thalassotalea litorea]|uniref:DUF927 domain-containing protein n=1 Tax=Thalassotalea litorea TaxID=2020715 RepID=A0A5R9IIU9_9GAMM|nr:DUF927 domain-containing protein [Thalassotalea litorea]TLU61207.1 DUF927 domain-containing protein [Thalassotalea litorea]
MNKLPVSFYHEEENLVYRPGSEDDTQSNKSLVVSSFFSVVAMTQLKGEPAMVVQFVTRTGALKQVVLPKAWLADHGVKIRQTLLASGLPSISTNHKARELVNHYLDQMSTFDTVRDIALVEKVGWLSDHYVMGNHIYGIRPDDFLLLGGNRLKALQQAGTLKDWQQHIGAMAVANSALAFAIAVGFSGPIIKLLNMNGFGFHFVGPSSSGKTTLCLCAASVWGPPSMIENWRMTDNAFELRALYHNDGVIVMDEISQALPSQVFDMVYMLGNGLGKTRATKSGELRDMASWRLVALSSGEKTLEHHLAMGDLKMQAGQDIRLASLQIGEREFGVFDYLYGFASGGEFSDHLVDACNKYYGSPMHVFLSHITSDAEKYRDLSNQIFKEYYQLLCANTASPQLNRVAKHVAAVGTAARLATEFRILPWKTEDVQTMMTDMLAVVAESRGGTGDLEDLQLLSSLQEKLVGKSQSNFIEIGDKRAASNFWGYRKYDAEYGDVLMIPSSQWKVINKGHDWRKAAKLAQQRGWMVPTSNPKAWQHNRRIGGSQVKHYIIRLECVCNDDLEQLALPILDTNALNAKLIPSYHQPHQLTAYSVQVCIDKAH